MDEGGKDANIGVAAGKGTVEDKGTAIEGIVEEDPSTAEVGEEDKVSFRNRRPIYTPYPVAEEAARCERVISEVNAAAVCLRLKWYNMRVCASF